MRGRKRKPDAFEWLRNPPEWVSDWDGNNLSTPEAVAASKDIHEYERRLSVSVSVSNAYADGRNTANRDRATAKAIASASVINDNGSIVQNQGQSASAAARVIIARGSNHGLGPRAIRDLVREVRKLARPNTA